MFAYQKKIRVQLKNGLSEEETKELTKKISNSLYRVSAGTKPWEIQSIVDPKIGLTNPETIFKDYGIKNCIKGYDSKVENKKTNKKKE